MTTIAVKERPILFSAPMVRAIREGRKTQTRRVVKHPGDFLGAGGRNGGDWDDPQLWGWEDPEDPGHFLVLARDPEPGDVPFRCPYGQPGGRLWVRETWAYYPDEHHVIYREREGAELKAGGCDLSGC
jgi:hypothetical protein